MSLVVSEMQAARVDPECRHAGKLVRKLCLSDLAIGFRKRGADTKEVNDLIQKLLLRTPGLTQLSLAHMRYSISRWETLVVRELPPLRSLHTLNLSDIVVSSDALRGAVAGAAATLQRLYLANTLVIDALRPASILAPIVGLREGPPGEGEGTGVRECWSSLRASAIYVTLPQLRALDLSHSAVEAKALLSFVEAHPSLAELYLAKIRLSKKTKKMMEWEHFVNSPVWPSPKYSKVLARLKARAALAIFDSELHNQAERALFDASPNEGARRLEDADGVAFLSALARVPKDACAGLDARNSNGRTAFIEAVVGGNLDLAQRLQELGADPEAVCHAHPHFAASPAKRWGSPFPFFPWVAPSPRFVGEEEGASPLHLPFRIRSRESPEDPKALAEVLRSLGLAPLVNARTHSGRTPLHVHATEGTDRSGLVVSALLALGSDPFIKDAAGENALFAVLQNFGSGVAAVEALMRTHPGLLETTDARGRSPLARLEVLQGVSSGILQALARVGAKSAEWLAAALHVAVAMMSSEDPAGFLIQSLLARPGADPNARGSGGRTLLMAAISVHYDRAWRPLLADPRIDLTARDDAGRTALHYAVMGECVNDAAFAELLKRPVDVNAIDGEGSTVLHLLLRPTHKNFTKAALLRLFERADVDTNLADSAGRTPLSLAVGCSEEVLSALASRAGGAGGSERS
eukprot:tig00000849_g4747.t1